MLQLVQHLVLQLVHQLVLELVLQLTDRVSDLAEVCRAVYIKSTTSSDIGV